MEVSLSPETLRVTRPGLRVRRTAIRRRGWRRRGARGPCPGGPPSAVLADWRPVGGAECISAAEPAQAGQAPGRRPPGSSPPRAQTAHGPHAHSLCPRVRHRTFNGPHHETVSRKLSKGISGRGFLCCCVNHCHRCEPFHLKAALHKQAPCLIGKATQRPWKGAAPCQTGSGQGPEGDWVSGSTFSVLQNACICFVCLEPSQCLCLPLFN